MWQQKQTVQRGHTHNAFLTYDKMTRKHLIFRIGDAGLPESQWCKKNEDTDANALASSQYPSDPIYVSSSDSLYGPWDTPGLRLDISGPNSSWVNRVSNPAPFIFPNGTVLLFATADSCPPDWGARAPPCIAMFRGDSWKGPFTLAWICRLYIQRMRILLCSKTLEAIFICSPT